MKKRFYIIAGTILFSALVFSLKIEAVTFTVTNNHDHGPHSLREAILHANADTTHLQFTIDFAIPGTGVHTITLQSDLPALVRPVTIDGYSQSVIDPSIHQNTLPAGSDAVLGIHIRGANVFINGLTFGIGADDSIVKGLIITELNNGILVQDNGNVQVIGNFLGTDGDVVLPNITAVFMDSTTGTLIGAHYLAGDIIDADADRNVIGGNIFDQCSVNVNHSGAVVIIHNLIGVDKTGTKMLGKSFIGVNFGGCTNCAAINNIISGSICAGIVNVNSFATNISNNFIGTNLTGDSALPNGTGINVTASCVETGIFNNLISGNDIDGIRVNPSQPANAAPFLTAIAANNIGTDVTGLKPLGNKGHGIRIMNRSSTVEIGVNEVNSLPNAPFENVISGNGKNGILISERSHNNFVVGNAIGTDLLGNVSIPNGQNGIQIGLPRSSSSRNTIGGSIELGGELTENIIKFNVGDGIKIEACSDNNLVQFNNISGNNKGVVVGASCKDQSVANSILSNSIAGNVGQGIDLANDGLTPNHKHSPSKGPNHFQNFPVLASAVSDGTSTIITGTLQSVPNSTFIIQFFVNPACRNDVTEGEELVGQITVKTNKKGCASFEATLPNFAAGTCISSTATRYTLEDTTDTSEFSPNVVVQAVGKKENK